MISQFIKSKNLGRLVTNKSAVITKQHPDTVRGPDVAYYSYTRLPKGPLAPGYGPEVPDLIIEVRSEHDRWLELQAKAAEYLRAGVRTVIILDPKTQSARTFTPDSPPQTLTADDILTIPAILEGFSTPVSRFFE